MLPTLQPGKPRKIPLADRYTASRRHPTLTPSMDIDENRDRLALILHDRDDSSDDDLSTHHRHGLVPQRVRRFFRKASINIPPQSLALEHSPAGRSGSKYALDGPATWRSKWARVSAMVSLCAGRSLGGRGGGMRAASSGSKACGIVNRDGYVLTVSTDSWPGIYRSCLLRSLSLATIPFLMIYGNLKACRARERVDSSYSHIAGEAAAPALTIISITRSSCDPQTCA